MHSTLGLLTLLLTGLPASADSETPPKGPPWHRSLPEARQAAIDADVPIFVYFTKTY